MCVCVRGHEALSVSLSSARCLQDCEQKTVHSWSDKVHIHTMRMKEWKSCYFSFLHWCWCKACLCSIDPFAKVSFNKSQKICSDWTLSLFFHNMSLTLFTEEDQGHWKMSVCIYILGHAFFFSAFFQICEKVEILRWKCWILRKIPKTSISKIMFFSDFNPLI